MFAGIEHVGVLAENPQKLAEWYERVLGFQVIFTTNGEQPTVFLAGENGYLLELVPHKNAGEILKDKRFHIAIGTNDFDEALAKLQSEKVKIEEPFFIFNGGRVVFFQDPEGNWLHLVYRPEIPWENS